MENQYAAIYVARESDADYELFAVFRECLLIGNTGEDIGASLAASVAKSMSQQMPVGLLPGPTLHGFPEVLTEVGGNQQFVRLNGDGAITGEDN